MDLMALITALGLALVIESIGPFAHPRGMRRIYLMASQIPDGQLRIMGLIGMIGGVGIVSLARG